MYKIFSKPFRKIRHWMYKLMDIGVVEMESSLSAIHTKKDGTVVDLGVICRKKVTKAFVNFLVDNLQTETSAFGDFKYHEVGTDNTAEANTQTTLETSSGIARATGTQTEGASANIYKTVATITADTTENWVEHGVFNASTGGTMMDRSVFAAIGVESGDTVQFTYELTCNAET